MVEPFEEGGVTMGGKAKIIQFFLYLTFLKYVEWKLFGRKFLHLGGEIPKLR